MHVQTSAKLVIRMVPPQIVVAMVVLICSVTAITVGFVVNPVAIMNALVVLALVVQTMIATLKAVHSTILKILRMSVKVRRLAANWVRASVPVIVMPVAEPVRVLLGHSVALPEEMSLQMVVAPSRVEKRLLKTVHNLYPSEKKTSAECCDARSRRGASSQRGTG